MDRRGGPPRRGSWLAGPTRGVKAPPGGIRATRGRDSRGEEGGGSGTIEEVNMRSLRVEAQEAAETVRPRVTFSLPRPPALARGGLNVFRSLHLRRLRAWHVEA